MLITTIAAHILIFLFIIQAPAHRNLNLSEGLQALQSTLCSLCHIFAKDNTGKKKKPLLSRNSVLGPGTSDSKKSFFININSSFNPQHREHVKHGKINVFAK